MGIRVEANIEKLKPFLDKNKCNIFHVCFAYPPSILKEKIMLRLDNWKYFTLHEIEKEIGEAVFTIIKK